MTRRIIVGIAVAVIGFATVYMPWTFYILVLAIGLVALYELNALCAMKGQPLEYPVAIFGVFAYLVLAMFGRLNTWEGALLAVVTIASFWIGMYGEEKGYFARTAYTLLAVLYIGKLLTYFVFIRAVPDFGLWWTVLVILMIAFSDIFAMVVGSLIGRHQLTVISPNKTIEGSAGALIIVTALGAAAALWWPPLNMQIWQGALLGLATCIAAQGGDLAESALKRDAGVKDTGTVIQGHGGVLDRFDSYLFGGMTFFGMLHVLGLMGWPT